MQLRQEEGCRATSPSGSSTAVSTASDNAQALDPASVCMALTQATAVFERWAGEHIRFMWVVDRF